MLFLFFKEFKILLRKNPRQVKSLGPLGEMMSEIIILKNQNRLKQLVDTKKSQSDIT